MKKGRQRARDASVGIIVTLAAVVFATGIFSIGSESRLWTEKVGYKLKLPNTNGLAKGSPVTLAGVQVGTVTGITLPSDPNRFSIDVDLAIDTAVQNRIREDTTASLRILSMLGGDKFVELTSGSPDKPALPPGSYIQVPEEVSLDEMQELGVNIAEDLKDVTAALALFLNQLQDRSTVIGQALFDPNFGRQTLGNISESVASVETILRQVETGQGLAGRLISDRAFAETMMSRMDTTLARTDALLERLGDENGAFMRLIAPGGSLEGLAANLEATSASLARITGSMDDGRGVAGRLLEDDLYADEVLENLRQTTRDLRDLMGKLNSGEGTAGALINDPQMYQDLRDVLRGVKESKLMSWMIRRYRQKGEEARIREMEERQKLVNEGEEKGDA